MHRIAPLVFISPQLYPDNLEALQHNGIAHIICNRLDDEEIGQPSFTDIAAAVDGMGITVSYIPIHSGKFTAEAITDTAELLAQDGGKLMYSKTGRTSVVLWAAVEASKGRGLMDILEAAEDAGYNIEYYYDFLRNYRF